MLEFKIIKHPDQLTDKIKSFDPQRTTWIVSDLKSKQDLQSICIEKNGYYIDDSILRISDFWKIWMRRLAPQIQIVSDDFILALVSKFIELYGHELELQKSDQLTLFQYMRELAPLILHKPSQDSLREWLMDKQPAPRWTQWELKAQACVNYVVNQHSCISTHWMVSYLQSLDLSAIDWKKNFIVDLGAQMTSLEMGVLNMLSKKHAIEVIVPDPDWKNKFNYLLRTYTDYIGYVKYQNIQPDKYASNVRADQFLRFDSEINEIKFITQQVRQWNTQGVSLQQICILSPRLEEYWPILKIHLEAEGIKVQKDLVSKCISLGVVQKLLSFVQAQTEDVKWDHLEMSYSILIENQNLMSEIDSSETLSKFQKFKSQFIELVDSEDLTKSDAIKKLFFNKINFFEKMNRNEFLTRVMICWLEVDPQIQYDAVLQSIIKDYIQNSVFVDLSFNEWFTLLKSRLAQVEIKIAFGFQNGLSALPLNSARALGFTHKIWFGLDESGLVGQQNRAIPTEDIAELKKTFDLALDYPEESISDFNLRWYSMSSCQEQFFTSSSVSAKADVLNISQFFIENNKKPSSAESYTVIDSLQHNFDYKHHKDLESKFKRENEAVDLSISHVAIKSISPSDVETYDKCSFKFLARKGFKLQSLDPEGYEIENRQRGNLVHALFQFILKDKQYLDFKVESVSHYLEEFRLQNRLFVNLDVFWIPQKNKFIKLAEEFAQIEKKRLEMMNSVSHYLEYPVEIYFDLNKCELTADKPTNDEFFIIRGRFDRMDVNNQSQVAILFDYKSAKNDSITYSNKWLETSQFQLIMYSLLVEKIFNFKVIGGLYYFYKNFKHNYGFLISDQSDQLTETITAQKNTYIELAEFQQLLGDFKIKLEQILQSIVLNKYAVAPSDEKHCEQCEAIRICRIKNRM